MFTGIIQVVGRVEAVRSGRAGAQMTIATPRRLSRLAVGESIAVNGVCLTVVRRTGARFTVDVSPETLRRTTLGTFRPGTSVNLERALRFGDRLGGHIVQGHVDGTGRVERVHPEDTWVAYRFSASPRLVPYLVEKGSIAVDGVSLTAFDCRGGRFSVALVPHTLAKTTLGKRRPGDPVNLEADLLLKHIATMVGRGVRSARRSARRA